MLQKPTVATNLVVVGSVQYGHSGVLSRMELTSIGGLPDYIMTCLVAPFSSREVPLWLQGDPVLRKSALSVPVLQVAMHVLFHQSTPLHRVVP